MWKKILVIANELKILRKMIIDFEKSVARKKYSKAINPGSFTYAIAFNLMTVTYYRLFSVPRFSRSFPFFQNTHSLFYYI